ncbi:helix-turn-helix transcriptional regulator [Salinarimonas sp.]|uniref:helix-turn-helix domain-containing protein n=1 Tax=Salinarimonas sp. TaxID=2766526 RepID=UPI0032D8CE62
MTRSPTEIDREIGQRIRLARKQAKLSQSELGQAIGVTYQQVQKYENGTDRVAASRLVQIATVLEQPASALLGGVEQGQARLMDEDAIALVALFNEIKRPALRGAALQTVKSLVAAGNEV